MKPQEIAKERLKEHLDAKEEALRRAVKLADQNDLLIPLVVGKESGKMEVEKEALKQAVENASLPSLEEAAKTMRRGLNRISGIQCQIYDLLEKNKELRDKYEPYHAGVASKIIKAIDEARAKKEREERQKNQPGS